MPSYRLLRSNKESGPYTLNDLVTLGLKPYDLVWVDGRSAAWRYPSEIAELKEFAPTIEEQPYDRFFKKPSEAQPEIHEKKPAVAAIPVPEVIAQEKTINENLVRPEIRPPYKPAEEPAKKQVVPEFANHAGKYESSIPKKKVFVSMPETGTFTAYKDPYPQEQKYEQYLPKPKSQEEKDIPQPQKSYSPINIQESEETKLETKYTQSLDDIKDMYINTLVQRKTRIKRKEIYKKYVKPALAPLLLVIAGIAIGYFITNRKPSFQASQSVTKVVPQSSVPAQKEEDVPLDNKAVPPDNTQVPSNEGSNEAQTSLVEVDHNSGKKSLSQKELSPMQAHKQNNAVATVPRAVLTDTKKQQSFIDDDEVANVPKKNVEVDASTGERRRVVRNTDDEIANRETSGQKKNDDIFERPAKRNNSERNFIETDRKNIRDLVSLKSNNYLRGAFGGIRGMELTVYNNSAFLVDEVSVEVQIMKPSEQPLRTDVITVRNIAANGAVTIKVPDSQRGIRVDYRITNIESRQWQKSTAGL